MIRANKLRKSRRLGKGKGNYKRLTHRFACNEPCRSLSRLGYGSRCVSVWIYRINQDERSRPSESRHKGRLEIASPGKEGILSVVGHNRHTRSRTIRTITSYDRETRLASHDWPTGPLSLSLCVVLSPWSVNGNSHRCAPEAHSKALPLLLL